MGVRKNTTGYKFHNLNWWINKKSGNVQIHPKIDLDKLYFKSHGSGTVGKVWEDHHKSFFNMLKPYLKGNICEIGGGNNSILKKIKNFSEIKSFYSFDKNLKIKKKNKKIIKIKDFFDHNFFIKKKIDRFQLIVHSHTFEHLYNPDKFLNTINSVLSEKGKHIFTLPNMSEMIKGGYANAMNFEHPFYFDETLVDNLLYKNNFKILKKKFFKKDHSIMYMTEVNKTSKSYRYEKYRKNLKTFNDLFYLWKKDIKSINQRIEKSKNTFVFGAHIFSQMLLFNGLKREKIIGILDNDQHKINNYLYGTRLKIFNPNFLKNINSPTVILRVGAYEDEIKKQIISINSTVKII